MGDKTIKEGEVSRRQKSPIGVMPYYIAQRQRIGDLAEAIARYANYVYWQDAIKSMRAWTNEIMQLLDMIESLDEGK